MADDAFEHEVAAAAGDAATALRSGVLAMPNPEPATLFDHVYAGPHTLLDAERDETQYLADYDEVSDGRRHDRDRDPTAAADATAGAGHVTTMTLGKALNAGLRQAMANDPKVVLMGEDIGKLGGVFRVTEGLQRDFGNRRVIDTPLAESGVIGTAVGLAVRGYRPVCEIQFDGFVYPAFDQIVSQVAKFRYRNEGRVGVPITIRVPYGGGIGAVEHHSESPEAYFAHTGGLPVVTPSNAADAHRMIQQAIASDDPVIFFEPKRRYWEKGNVDTSAPLDAMPLHRARVVRAGTDVTVVAYGPMVATSLEAAGIGGRRESRSRSSTCARCPIDFETIEVSVRKTGRLVVVHEAPVFCGLGAEIAARVGERCFYSLSRRCAGSVGSPRPTRRPSSSATSCPTPIASSTRSTGA